VLRSYKVKTLLRYKTLLRRILLGETTVGVVLESVEDLQTLSDLKILGKVHPHFADPTILREADLHLQEELSKIADTIVQKKLVQYGNIEIADRQSRVYPPLRAFYLSREDVSCEQVVQEIEHTNDPITLKVIARHRASSAEVAAALWKRVCSACPKERGSVGCVLLFNASESFLQEKLEELLQAGAEPFYLFVRDDFRGALYERAAKALPSDKKLQLLRARNLSTKALEALSKDADPLVSRKAKEKLYRRLRYLKRRTLHGAGESRT